MDVGSTYELAEPNYDRELTLVGRGTPMGELFRRYWHPVALSGEASATPKKVHVLGEELILFRDQTGRPGLLYPRCAHRGTTLYYGKVDDRGIRCCYHGWLFDVEGHCLEQPCEPEGGRYRNRVRQPWTPLQEYHGLVFAYLGPAELKPAFPVYGPLETIEDGQCVVADDSGIGIGGPAIADFNWLQHWENVMDPFHVPVLHGTFSGLQFTDRMAAMPDVKWSYTERGICSVQERPGTDEGRFVRVSELMVPNVRIVPDPRVATYGPVAWVSWVVPLGDTSFKIFTLARVNDPSEVQVRSTFEGRPWSDLSEAEHQRLPGDYEAQKGQGEITYHSEEHLATSDRGITMVRHLLRKELEALRSGHDPRAVTRGADTEAVDVQAGNFLVRDPGPLDKPADTPT